MIQNCLLYSGSDKNLNPFLTNSPKDVPKAFYLFYLFYRNSNLLFTEEVGEGALGSMEGRSSGKNSKEGTNIPVLFYDS